MEMVLLLGADPAHLREIKGRLVRSGFRVIAVSAGEPERLEGILAKERFSLGVLDATGSAGLAPLLDLLRSRLHSKELGLMALVNEHQMRELEGISGLEDFCVAPFPPELLEARVRFLMKRLNHWGPGGGIRIGALEVNPDRYEILLEGEPLELTYKEFELFKFLATHPSRVFDRDQLLNQVWGYDYIGGTRTVDVHIRRLRAKLGPKYASLIATVRNVGYKFTESL